MVMMSSTSTAAEPHHAHARAHTAHSHSPVKTAVCPTDHESIEPVLPRPGGGAQVTEGKEKSKQELDKRSFDYLLRSGIAGGFAGCAAKTVVGPLDRVKILFQASNPQFAKYASSWFGVVTAMQTIKQQEGLTGLFKGHSATLLRIFPYAAIKFLAYEQVRAVVIPDKHHETPFRRLISGSMAGITSVFSTYPLELIRVRLAFETKHSTRSSLRSICRTIYNEPSTPSSTSPGGLANFYRGFSPTLLGMLPYAGVSFLTHDTVGDWLRHESIAEYTTIPHSSIDETSTHKKHLAQNYRTHRPQLTASAQLFAGAIAGLVSQTSSYPFEVIRRRMQVSGAVQKPPPTPATTSTDPKVVARAVKQMKPTILGTAKLIWKERGFRGFWVGLTIGYMKVLPMGATSFYVYERAKWWLGI